jgi:hypothetical protein
MKAIILIVGCTLLSHCEIFAQAISEVKIIEGVVTDNNTHEPLYLANVSIIGTRIGTTTDPQGKFKIFIPDSILQHQEIIIRSSYPGFFTDTFIFTSKQLPQVLNFALLEKHAIFMYDKNYPVIGYAVDALTHKPIIGVKVMPAGTKSVVFSRSNGTFTIIFPKNRKRKKATVYFSKKGFVQVQLTVDTSDWVEELVVRLSPRRVSACGTLRKE